MLYHEVPKRVNQIFAMLVKNKVNDNTYKVISRNYFDIKSDFEILGRNLKHIEKIKVIEIVDKDNLQVNVVNTPMQVLTIKLNKNVDLEPNDILRISI
ncbi:hypothetical protein FACS1894166_06120 [Bacilli bacterium]|nr:hypothetical protein FACS1894166_06120 [Bacilli bacterium]